MKKRILLVAMLQLFIVLNSCSSDSGNDSTPTEEEIKGEIKADYIINSRASDFVVNNDNTVYQIGQGEDATNGYFIGLKKVDSEGKETLLKTLDLGNFTFGRLSLMNNGDLLLVSKGNPDSDKILRFENNFSVLNPFYTMKPISSPFASKINLLAISNNSDNTYFVFDYDNKQIKRFVPELTTDVFVAGSGKNEIKDGVGLTASFGAVLKIISFNNVLYVIDNLYESGIGTFKSSTIRKLEYVNNDWKVTTLISTTSENSYNDIALDSNNGLYVLVKGKGIYKLNLQDNTLSLFRGGEIKVGSGNRHALVDLGYAELFKIKDNDLYIRSYSDLIKISDFQTKFATAAAGK